jgi:hypothetical protein
MSRENLMPPEVSTGLGVGEFRSSAGIAALAEPFFEVIFFLTVDGFFVETAGFLVEAGGVLAAGSGSWYSLAIKDEEFTVVKQEATANPATRPITTTRLNIRAIKPFSLSRGIPGCKIG